MRIVLYNPKSNAAGKRIMPFSLLALGAVVEVGAWIALLTDRSEGSFPGVKQ